MNGAYLVTASVLLLTLISGPSVNTQQSDYPMMDKIVQKVIDKYQKTSCEDLKAQKQDPESPSAQQAAMIQKAIGLREQFLNKVAPPIANKMFECGMIP